MRGNHTDHSNSTENKKDLIYWIAGYSAILVISGILLDIAIGTMTGGDISSLPQTAVERFAQFQKNPWLGLYNLDLLNAINQFLLIPAYLTLYIMHRKTCKNSAALSLVIFLVGTTLFIAGNSALSMLELSNKFAASGNEAQRSLFSAAGEAMLANGAHGSPGVFLGFLVPNIAGVMMALVMLKGRLFSGITAWLGITGNLLLILYIILVTFIPAVGGMAMVIAMPGGLMTLTWLILITVRFFKIANRK